MVVKFILKSLFLTNGCKEMNIKPHKILEKELTNQLKTGKMKDRNKTSLLPDYLFEKLPKDLKAITQNYKGRERDMVLLSCLGVISSCLPNYYGVYDGHDVAVNLYIMIIAPPASGKGVIKNSLELINRIDEEIRKRSLKEIDKVKKANTKESVNSPLPPVEHKIFPGNITSADFYQHLENSKHGALILESEADTISNMLKSDFGNYSDILRKAFHHEILSISRKTEKLYGRINNPKLSMVISGTPDQLQPLIKSRDNGLFSRFILYNFDEVSPFKNVFEKNDKSYVNDFKKLEQKLFEFYGFYRKDGRQILFKLDKDQEAYFTKIFSDINDKYVQNFDQNFLPNIRRHAFMCFRLMMIISLLRNIDNLIESKEENAIVKCENSDIELSIDLIKRLLDHCYHSYVTLGGATNSTTLQDKTFLKKLESNFTSQQAYEIGKILGIKKRVVDDKIRQFLDKNLISRVKKGHFKKHLKK